MQLEPERLVKILEVLRELPVPNYRCAGFLPTPVLAPPTARLPLPGALTFLSSQSQALPMPCDPCVTLTPGTPLCRTLEFLMRHLVHMASFSAQTNMHARNLAIVWAPNLLRWACVSSEWGLAEPGPQQVAAGGGGCVGALWRGPGVLRTQ